MTEEITIRSREFVKKVLDALNGFGAQYMLIGGIAAIHYGRSRSTIDCDIVLSLSEGQLGGFCKYLKSYGFEIREYDLIQAFKEKSHFNAYLEGYPFRVDFSWKGDSLTKAGFKRAVKTHFFGVTTIIEQPEDIIIAKIVYGSPQDFDDAKAIIMEQKNLDKKYLEKRAKEEGVKRKLDELYASVK